MATNGDGASIEHEDTGISEAFSALAKLEQDFAVVELDALRQSEYAKRELYTNRSKLLQQIPSFWPTVLGAGPDEFQAILSENDGEVLASITNLNIERYQIKSDTEGEPRSLRFTFEFDSELFEDKSVTKDFEFIANDDVQGGGGYVSKPVNFKWTKAGKKKGVNKMLDLAEQLYQAEMALGSTDKKDKSQWAIDHKSREGLWQFEKLRDAMEKEEEKAMDGEDVDSGRSFLDWFGYRGAVGLVVPDATPAPERSDKNGEEEDEDEDEDDTADPTLDIEIFPAADDIATALAEDLWPNIMDYFMQAQDEDDDDVDVDMSGDEEDDDAPELVEFDGFDADERPAKKARKA